MDDAKNPANWPNDPDWGYKTADLPKDREKGQWEYFGFQPDRSPGAPALRADEVGKASGISLDLAWRYTTGSPKVVIAILDSGPKWDDKDIANKAYINVGELGSHKPKTKTGPCMGKGDFPEFDCNGDGVVTVQDWADDPSLVPAASMGHPQGDKNNNGILDAGDLILNFSDGVDDDKNGYVDDISGWDFLMDDNDPYEDTRFYHGTNQAKDAAAETNNMMGGVGVCPQCRFVPLRVADSFIATGNEFAQASAYAADMGAAAIECALGAITTSKYAHDAVEYAWKKGTIVTASMADENSKHQNAPNTANYVFAAHSIINNGANGDVTSAESFLCFEPGSNYGGNNYISTTTEAASSGAAGVNSGVVGMMQSAAIKYGSYPLAPGEILQLFTMTADDIDVGESRMPMAKYYWSQKGFDQRFGYGRTNVNTAVEWIKDGKIPPEVNITDPVWFDNFYTDRTPTAELHGTISAKRATSYDYVVEWAPGVQPLDEAFKTITKADGIDGKTVTGDGGAPLATLDLANMDPKHERDVDSPFGENDNAITIRIRVKANYPGIGQVPGEYRRTIYAQKDPDLLPGFPIKMKTSFESSPKLADIDGDGVREIVQADASGNVHAWKITKDGPVELPGFPFKAKRADGLVAGDPPAKTYLGAKAYQAGGIDPDEAREGFVATVAIADVDGDGKPEIAASTYEGTLYLIDTTGKAKPGWPVRLPYVPSCPLDPTVPKPDICMSPTALLQRGAFASPVLIDMNKDGKLDFVQAAQDGHIYIFDSDGKALPGWPVRVHHDGGPDIAKEYNRILTTPAVADANGDGIPDILTGSSEKLGGGSDVGAFYLIDGRGTLAPGATAARPGYMPNWPVGTGSLNVLVLLGEGVTTSGAFFDLDGDGKPEALYHGNGSPPVIVPVDPGGQDKITSTPKNAMPTAVKGNLSTGTFGDFSTAKTPDVMFPLFAHPTIGDLDLDGTPDVIAGGGSLSLLGNLTSKGNATIKPAQFLVGAWNGKTGKMFPYSPFPIEDYMFVNSQTIADITGDGVPEIITGSGGFHVRAFDVCGREAAGFPKKTGQWVMATTAVGDIDGDGTLEAVVGTRSGFLYAWKTKGKADGVIQWPTWHHDNQNTGNYNHALDQGKLTGDPVVCPDPSGTGGGGGASGAGGSSAGGSSSGTANGATEPEGGCGCAVPSNGRVGLVALALGACGVMLLRRRRRA